MGLLIHMCETGMIQDYVGINQLLYLLEFKSELLICLNIYIPAWEVFSCGHSHGYYHDQVKYL